ncbi:MAG TPA: glutamate--tRNA ligase [Rhodospirillales bacterium]|nr:glutamate--tRNA ligase [Rhodospirillales bacterium]
MAVVTRFAPSPTGYLHIGGARTALFNWLYAKHCRGRFLLRIEDTDRARSTPAATAAILDGLSWLGLDWEGEPISQTARADRHAEVARQLLATGHAYLCYASAEELAEMRARAKAEGRPARYDGRWRDRQREPPPPGVAPVVRFKAPQSGETRIADHVQGEVVVQNEMLDDMVLLRADGTPTYMLAVVVDDHDMAVTHVVRGDDHLTNAFRQYHLYLAMSWQPPEFAHIPLIHGPDGAKLSKRHGALAVQAYREMGFLPEALSNYLLRLGWGRGDEEIISHEDAIAWFDLDAIGRAPARFDLAKLTSLNAHYLRQADDRRLADLVMERLVATANSRLAEGAHDRIMRGMEGLKQRARTLVELTENAAFYAIALPLASSPKAAALLTGEAKRELGSLRPVLAAVEPWAAGELEAAVRAHAEGTAGSLRGLAQPLRAALTGKDASPPIFEVMDILGRDETLRRLDDVLDEAIAAKAR